MPLQKVIRAKSKFCIGINWNDQQWKRKENKFKAITKDLRKHDLLVRKITQQKTRNEL